MRPTIEILIKDKITFTSSQGKQSRKLSKIQFEKQKL